MTFEITAEEGSTLYNAAALRGLADNRRAYCEGDRLAAAKGAADAYSTVLNEVSYILLVALGKVQPGEDGEGDPLALAKEAAAQIDAGHYC